MFRLFRLLTIMTVGMLFAPKKGVELRADLVAYLNKYKPQLKKLILSLEDTWEKAKSSESDEAILDVETKLATVREAAVELDAAKTKEIAYKALSKLGGASLKVGKEIQKSPNFISIAKDLALISVNALDRASSVYSKVRDVSTSFVEDVNEPSVKDKSDITKIDESIETSQKDLIVETKKAESPSKVIKKTEKRSKEKK